MTSLYIHIPFCKRKCNYCDFVSYANKEELIDDYVEALIQEINSPPLSPSLNKRGGNRVPPEEGRGGGELKTIYFGGGTPTLLSPQHFEKILSRLPLAVCRELTTEANPGTIDRAYLKELRQLGINRLSLGAQTFNDKHLKTLGRIHDSKQIFEAVEDARAAGFDNLNLDLIFALPDQTFEEWKKDLATALSLKPEHLSTYNLQIEPGTPLHEVMTKKQDTSSKQVPSSKFQIPNEDVEADMYEYTIEMLTANGYWHYEISNFARPGKECRHNINYWKNGDYIGIGAGAHSHLNGERWANPDSIDEYINRNSVAVTKPVSSNEARLTGFDTGLATDKRDTLFMGLRLLEGLPIGSFQGFENEVNELQKDGLLIRNNGHLKLSRRGLFLANLVFEKFV